MAGEKVAIGHQLSHCNNVITLGVRRKLAHYEHSDLKLICQAEKIYFPSFFLYRPMVSLGKRIFPNANYYEFFSDKTKQTMLFDSVGLPQPRTRIYSGGGEKRRILNEWTFPFIAKIPRKVSFGLGVYFIEDERTLDLYLGSIDEAYIQEYLPIERDLRVVMINNKVRLAYWRYMPQGEFRTNVFRGGRISFDNVPDEALAFALKAVELCDFDNVGLDICEHKGEYFVFEANMGYGIEGFRQAGLDYKTLLKQMVENDEI
jgi:ribosomal protein S6--L-glutamate ligase